MVEGKLMINFLRMSQFFFQNPKQNMFSGIRRLDLSSPNGCNESFSVDGIEDSLRWRIHRDKGFMEDSKVFMSRKQNRKLVGRFAGRN
jgi:hypothetical protein